MIPKGPKRFTRPLTVVPWAQERWKSRTLEQLLIARETIEGVI